MGAAAAPGHARLRRGLCLHRLPAVQRSAADLDPRGLRCPGTRVPRNPQHARCRLGLHLLAVPVRLPAGPYRAGRTGVAADGGRPAAGRSHGTTHPRSRAAAGPAGRGRRCGPGADGDAGRFRCGQLFRRPDLHGRDLQGLAGDGQPGGGGPAGHHAAGTGRPAFVAGTSGATAHALCRPAGATGGQRRGPACPAAWPSGLAGLAGVCGAHPGWICPAGGVHGAPPGGRLGRTALDHVRAMVGQQCPAGGPVRTAGHAAGLGHGLCPAHAAGLAHAGRGAAHRAGLCGAWGGDRRRPAPAGGLGAGGAAGFVAGLLDHRHRHRDRLGLPGALHGGGPAVGPERLRPRTGQPGRFRPHAGQHRAGLGQAGALAAAAPLDRRRGAAGVRRRDERAARHAGAAAVQQRYPGRRGLPAGTR